MILSYMDAASNRCDAGGGVTTGERERRREANDERKGAKAGLTASEERGKERSA